MKNIIVSVIITTFRRTDTLKRAINSVFEQTYPHIEIIVVDDNGIESEYSNQVKGLLGNFCNDITYIQHNANRGGCAARNTGINLANGNYIAFLDDDDEWNTKFIEKLIGKFTNQPNVAAVYSDFFLIRDNENINFNIKFHSGYIREKLIDGWSPASTSLFILRKSSLIEVNGFDEDLKSFQDYDLWLRLAENHQFIYFNEKLVNKHEHDGEQVSINPRIRELGLKQLKYKWFKKLNESDIKKFKQTVHKFQQQIYLAYLRKSKINYCFADVFKYFVVYSISKPFRAQNIIRALVIVINYRQIKKK